MKDADLLTRYDGRIPRYTSYPTAPHFNASVGPETYAAWLQSLPDDAALSLYVHVPFCDRLCLYCGCNTTVVRHEAPRRSYATMLEREIRMVASLIGRRATVGHVHWGGGTPTTLPADCLTGIMATIREVFDLAPGAEVAIEIDPTVLPADRVAALSGMGITRASLGVQDLEPQVQAAIGRKQSYESTEACAQTLRGMGITSLNLDLIYGLPHQTTDSVARTARRALGLGADRVAVFGYAHVPWMKRHQALIDEASLPGPHDRFAQSRMIDRVLQEEGGYIPVGLDHYARPGDAMAEAAAASGLKRNFQGYTTDAAPALIGLGASSIGGLPQGYAQNATGVPAYSAAIGQGVLATVRGVTVSAEDRLRRAVIERIMCGDHTDFAHIAAAHGASPALLLSEAAAAGLAQCAADGLVRWDGQSVQITERGRPFARNVAALFDTYLKRDDAKPRHAQAV